MQGLSGYRRVHRHVNIGPLGRSIPYTGTCKLSLHRRPQGLLNNAHTPNEALSLTPLRHKSALNPQTRSSTKPTTCKSALIGNFSQPEPLQPKGLGLGPLPQRQAPLRNVTCKAASLQPSTGPSSWVSVTVQSIRDQISKLDGLWNRFIPMSLLFFLLAFLNTIFDSLKDSLVVTAVGGGSGVLPYLTVYAVLPTSVLFLIAYSWGTQRFSREKLFNIIIVTFLCFYAGFAFLYPMHESLHLSTWADDLTAAIPSGLAGLVGVFRNWMFTLFYCASELWGDVVLSLLFWGLANETTSIEDAPLLYPLFGVGANVAQTVAGRVLRLISDTGAGSVNYTAQLQSSLGICVALGFVILGLHTYISRTFPLNPKGSTAKKMAAAAAAAAAEAEHHRLKKIDLEASVTGLNYCDIQAPHPTSGAASSSSSSSSTAAVNGITSNGGNNNGGSTRKSSNSNGVNTSTAATSKPHKAKPKAMSLKEAWNFLKASPQIRCLAMMALAQGITTRLLQVTWMHYLHELHTTPAAYAAFLGDTAMWTGIVTGTLMFTSPMLFDRIGWRGVASVTPNVMIWGGVPFFIGCIVYNFVAGHLYFAGAVTLQALVITGAIMQVFSRGAKFSLFKPAEEMVYIGLDDESRTKGKAAIDVVGAQSGKGVGSVLQQALLIITGGTIGGILPVLAIFYAYMLREWKISVSELALHYDPQHVHRISVLGSLDEDFDSDEQLDFQIPSPAGAA